MKKTIQVFSFLFILSIFVTFISDQNQMAILTTINGSFNGCNLDSISLVFTFIAI